MQEQAVFIPLKNSQESSEKGNRFDFQQSSNGGVKESIAPRNPNKFRQKRPAASLAWVKSRE
jgi:hypothetical protein